MELRRVDPRILKQNPRNPRKIQPGEMSDAALAANISAIGILQPPAVTEKNGELTIATTDSNTAVAGAGISPRVPTNRSS